MNIRTLHLNDQEVGISEQGGNIVHWKESGRDIFFPQQKLEGSVRGRSHLCFPNYGPADGLPQHGPLRDLESCSTSVYDATVARMVFENIIVLKTMISIAVHVSLREKGFSHTIEASHVSGPSLPVNGGFHPYFFSPSVEDTKVVGMTNGLTVFEHTIDSDFAGEDMVLPMTEYVLIINSQVGTVMMTPGRLFRETPSSKIVIWRGKKGSPYLCVEPVLGMPETYGTEKCSMLQPKGHMFFSCRFELQ